MKGIAAFVLCATVILACAFALFMPKMSAPVDFQVAKGLPRLCKWDGTDKQRRYIGIKCDTLLIRRTSHL